MRKIILGVLTSASTLAGVLGSAHAQPAYYDRHESYYRNLGYYRHTSCYHDRRHAGNQGTALGAVSGGVLGGVIGHSVVGGLVGAGVGAVAGHEIAKSRVHC